MMWQLELATGNWQWAAMAMGYGITADGDVGYYADPIGFTS